MTETLQPFDDLRYTLAQRLRMAWYTGHYFAARRVTARLRKGDAPPMAGLPRRQAVIDDLKALMARERAQIAAGTYRMPHDLFENPLDLIDKSLRFFRDLPVQESRRAEARVRDVATDDRRGQYPDYYLQNFHHQTDGYLSSDSARLYDFQVETLFTGTGDLMRRQGLVPLAAILKGRDQRRLKLLDVATGTGGFLAAVKHNYPRLPVTGIDLSPDYLAEARKKLRPWRGVTLTHGNAEKLPFADQTFDVVTSVYLFHELPAAVRRRAAAEMARVLKPGGRVVFVDTLQLGDVPDFDDLLRAFPDRFHEPYYAGYIASDLDDYFSPAGLTRLSDTPAFLSKVSVFGKA